MGGNALLRRCEAVTADNQAENKRRGVMWLAPTSLSNEVVLACAPARHWLCLLQETERCGFAL